MSPFNLPLNALALVTGCQTRPVRIVIFFFFTSNTNENIYSRYELPADTVK